LSLTDIFRCPKIPIILTHPLKKSLQPLLAYFETCSSSVCIVTRLWAGQLGFDSQQVQGSSLFATSKWVRKPGHEADHSPPPSPEVKNVPSYTSSTQYIFMAWSLIKLVYVSCQWDSNDEWEHFKASDNKCSAKAQ